MSVAEHIRPKIRAMLVQYGNDYFLEALALEFDFMADNLQKGGFEPASVQVGLQAKRIWEAQKAPFIATTDLDGKPWKDRT